MLSETSDTYGCFVRVVILDMAILIHQPQKQHSSTISSKLVRTSHGLDNGYDGPEIDRKKDGKGYRSIIFNNHKPWEHEQSMSTPIIWFDVICLYNFTRLATKLTAKDTQPIQQQSGAFWRPASSPPRLPVWPTCGVVRGDSISTQLIAT